MRKTCRKCGQTKLAAEFVTEPRNADGLSSTCRPCSYAARVGRRKIRAAGRPESFYDEAFADPQRVKVCRRCRQTKHVTLMSRDGHAADGFRTLCLECNRDDHRQTYDSRARQDTALRSKYGMTVEQYEALLHEQGGRCAICGADSGGLRAHAVDHCHATGQVRGLLCSPCNRGMGLLGDDPERLRAAADYLAAASSG